jgi:hypothetical protein
VYEVRVVQNGDLWTVEHDRNHVADFGSKGDAIEAASILARETLSTLVPADAHSGDPGRARSTERTATEPRFPG